jgi:UDP-2,3-diacylglucosamine pyrophosphatase LpxH
MSVARTVYVISDLHIGGSYPDPRAPRKERQRGFRMMTRAAELAGFVRHLARLPGPIELVINGDFVDFLAEEDGSGRAIDPDAPPAWKAFRAGREEARDAFSAVVARDKDLFTAFAALVAAGKHLTIVLGNHDIELSMPDVRAALVELLGPGRVTFLGDGQALDLGDVLIDHGNLFDPANVVDHDQLRLLRALYSRGWFDRLGEVFTPPAGSSLVAEIMNPVKVDYGFVDLLKPESEPLFALLLALEPSYRDKVEELAVVLARAVRTLVPRRDVPYRLRNVNALDDGGASTLANVAATGQGAGGALDTMLEQTLATQDRDAVAALRGAGLDAGASAAEVGGGVWRARWSLLRLLVGDEDGDLESRIPQVQACLRVLQDDTSFRRDVENPRYADAASWLSERGPSSKGYRAVIFGHTHHAKDLTLESGARYLNTGTWANVMRFPAKLTDPRATPEQVRDALVEFAGKLIVNDLAVDFEPTYVQLGLKSDGTLANAELRTYDWRADKL